MAASVSLSSNACCHAQALEPMPTDPLKGQVTAGPTQVSPLPSKLDNDPAALFDTLTQSRPEVSKSGITKKTVSKVVSLGNFMFDLRGFDWSVEGANVALGEKLDYKSEMSKEYAVRRKHNQHELDTICGIFQTAMVTGLNQSTRSDELLAAGNTKLTGLIGEEKTKELNERFKQLSQQASAPNPVLDQAGEAASWTVDEQQEKFKTIVEAAIEKDDQIKNILFRMHKFNGRSKFARVSAKVVYTTLGIAAFAPTFVAPAAEASLLAFMTATGGPEQDKLLREMYLCKCLESRYRTIHEEAHLAVTNAQVAALTGNSPLAACSLGLVGHMAGADVIAKVFPSYAGRQIASDGLKQPSDVAGN